MIDAVLQQAAKLPSAAQKAQQSKKVERAKRKVQILRMADGAEYEVPLNVTQAYIDQVSAYHEQQVRPYSSAVAQAGKGVAEAAPSTPKRNNMPTSIGAPTPEGIKAAEEYERFSKTDEGRVQELMALNPKLTREQAENTVAKSKGGTPFGSGSQAVLNMQRLQGQARGVIDPVLGPMAEAAAKLGLTPGISLGALATGQNDSKLARDLAVGGATELVTAPFVAVSGITQAQDPNLPVGQRLGAAAEAAAAVLPIDVLAVKAGTKIVKGIKGAVKGAKGATKGGANALEKALSTAEGGGIPTGKPPKAKIEQGPPPKSEPIDKAQQAFDAQRKAVQDEIQRLKDENVAPGSTSGEDPKIRQKREQAHIRIKELQSQRLDIENDAIKAVESAETGKPFEGIGFRSGDTFNPEIGEFHAATDLGTGIYEIGGKGRTTARTIRLKNPIVANTREELAQTLGTPELKRALDDLESGASDDFMAFDKAAAKAARDAGHDGIIYKKAGYGIGEADDFEIVRLGDAPKPATGLANQVQEREAIEGIINDVTKTKGKGAEHWQKVGKEAVEQGKDPQLLARRIATGEEELTGEKVGILLEGKRQLQNKLNQAAPGEEFNAVLKELDEYLDNVQQGKGRWSDVGRALQAGIELDTGDFAQVIEHVRNQGGRVDERLRSDLEDMTGKVRTVEEKLKATEVELAAERAKRTTAATAKRAPRFSREELDAELDDLLKQFSEKTAKLSAGIDPEILPILGKIAVNYMKRGVSTIDDIVKSVQTHFKDATYEDVVQAIDAATTGVKRTRSEIEKQIASLKRQAKSSVKARQEIANLRKQLETGDYDIPTKREKVLNRQLEDLRAERDLLKGEVMGRVGRTLPTTIGQKTLNVLNAPKSLKSSIDLSAPGRQGWVLSLANPDRILPALRDQFKALFSGKGAIRVQNEILKRKNAALYKRSGLYIAPMEGGVSASEEAFKTSIFPRWTKFNPFLASGRAYTAYLNRMRADIFDRLVKWAGPNATDDDLKVIANYINVASGRGGKSVGIDKAAEALNNAFFSPRYLASRFELLAGQPLLTTQGAIGKSLKARALVATEYARFLGGIGGTLYLAKLAGANFGTDPKEADFLSPTIGRTKIDILAGMRQLINFGARMTDTSKESNAFKKEAAAGRFARSKASPTIGTAYSLMTGKDYTGDEFGLKDAAVDLIAPLSLQELIEGFRKDGWSEEDAYGLLNFLGFGTQSYEKGKQKKDRPN